MLPFKARLNQFTNGGRGDDHRLTWAWSCDSTAKALAFYMVNHQGRNSCGEGGVNQQAWYQARDSNPILQVSGIKYLSAYMPMRMFNNLLTRFEQQARQAVAERVVGKIQQVIQALTQDVLP